MGSITREMHNGPAGIAGAIAAGAAAARRDALDRAYAQTCHRRDAALRAADATAARNAAARRRLAALRRLNSLTGA